MIGEDLLSGVPLSVHGKPEPAWFRLTDRLLTEMRDLLRSGQHAKLVGSSSSRVIIASSGILADAVVLRLSSAGVITVVAVPTIQDGEDGQLVCLTNAGTNNITVQDQGTLAGSNLRLSATTLVLAPRASLWLRFDAVVADWIQITSMVTVL